MSEKKNLGGRQSTVDAPQVDLLWQVHQSRLHQAIQRRYPEELMRYRCHEVVKSWNMFCGS